jgi:hypothetical protein
LKVKKVHRKLKITLWIVGAILVLVLIGLVSLAIMSRQAVSSYRSDAAEQLNSVVNGKESGVPVELRGVLLGETLSGDYKHVKSLDADYKELLTDVKGYVTVLNAHNSIVEQYNAGIKGEKPLGGDLLISVNRYKAAFENRFPDEKDRIKAISDLSTKITSNTDFDAVSTDIDTVLQSGDKFLAESREKLNTRINEFQKKVN